VLRAADRFPGLVPGRDELAAERELPQARKRGAEVEQGRFLSRVLAHPRAGLHLVHAMLRPRAESLALLDEFRRTGRADLGEAAVERRGAAGHVELRNLRFLNAETWSCWTRTARSACSGAASSTIPAMPAGACSTPAST